VSDDRRAVLEAIAYGSESSIRPGERLRAMSFTIRRRTGRLQNEDGAGATGLEPALHPRDPLKEAVRR